MIRGPLLQRAYGDEIYGYFQDAKNIFDPQGIFNPHKKANADWDWTMSHIRQSF